MLICPHWKIIFSNEFSAWSLPVARDREEKCLETSLFFLDTLAGFLAPICPLFAEERSETKLLPAWAAQGMRKVGLNLQKLMRWAFSWIQA